jgi:hypothetical protein
LFWSTALDLHCFVSNIRVSAFLFASN